MLGFLVSKADKSPCLQGAYILVGKEFTDTAGRKVKQGSVWVGAVCRLKCH